LSSLTSPASAVGSVAATWGVPVAPFSADWLPLASFARHKSGFLSRGAAPLGYYAFVGLVIPLLGSLEVFDMALERREKSRGFRSTRSVDLLVLRVVEPAELHSSPPW
jgi:hypothetical protein